MPRRAKLAVGFAALWCLSPIDLIPEFLPVMGPLDDVVVVIPSPTQLLDLVGGYYQIQRTTQFASHINVPLIPSDQLQTSPANWGSCNGGC